MSLSYNPLSLDACMAVVEHLYLYFVCIYFIYYKRCETLTRQHLFRCVV
jgi:hypothetical protein